MCHKKESISVYMWCECVSFFKFSLMHWSELSQVVDWWLMSCCVFLCSALVIEHHVSQSHLWADGEGTSLQTHLHYSRRTEPLSAMLTWRQKPTGSEWFRITPGFWQRYDWKWIWGRIWAWGETSPAKWCNSVLKIILKEAFIKWIIVYLG